MRTLPEIEREHGEALAEARRELILQALDAHGGSVYAAARTLDVTEPRLRRLIASDPVLRRRKRLPPGRPAGRKSASRQEEKIRRE